MAASFYRAYVFGSDGTVASIKLLNAGNDAEALGLARALAGAFGAEVWEGVRFVAQMEPEQGSAGLPQTLDARSAYATRGFEPQVPGIS